MVYIMSRILVQSTRFLQLLRKRTDVVKFKYVSVYGPSASLLLASPVHYCQTGAHTSS